MELTLTQLNKDKVKLNADILKLISDFQSKYNVEIYRVEHIETHSFGNQFPQVAGINVEIRL